ncbi:MAG: hypothetical protein ACD_37C00398G0008 [uncultured bacterium]|nr:MAG: hypothetical protein ACD_37C00398G0008 [uncultured bacterium]
MLQPDRQESLTGIGISPAERLVPNPYVQEFEQRLAALQPLFDYQTPGVKFDMNSVGLQPDKFTAAIFFNRGQTFEVLLGKKYISGYFQEDHWDIEEEHPEVGIYPSLEARPAFIAEMDGLRFAMIGYFMPRDDGDVDKLKDTLKRYGIAMVMSYDGKEIMPLLDDLDQGVSVSGGYE